MPEPYDPERPYKEHLLPYAGRRVPRGAASGPENTTANTLHSFEQFVLEDGEKKVEMKLDTRGLLVQIQRLHHSADISQECQIHLSLHLTRKIILLEISCVRDYFKIAVLPSPHTRCV
jgi:hypothetical protein